MATRTELEPRASLLLSSGVTRPDLPPDKCRSATLDVGTIAARRWNSRGDAQAQKIRSMKRSRREATEAPELRALTWCLLGSAVRSLLRRQDT